MIHLLSKGKGTTREDEGIRTRAGPFITKEQCRKPPEMLFEENTQISVFSSFFLPLWKALPFDVVSQHLSRNSRPFLGPSLRQGRPTPVRTECTCHGT